MTELRKEPGIAAMGALWRMACLVLLLSSGLIVFFISASGSAWKRLYNLDPRGCRGTLISCGQTPEVR